MSDYLPYSSIEIGHLVKADGSKRSMLEQASSISKRSKDDLSSSDDDEVLSQLDDDVEEEDTVVGLGAETSSLIQVSTGNVGTASNDTVENDSDTDIATETDIETPLTVPDAVIARYRGKQNAVSKSKPGQKRRQASKSSKGLPVQAMCDLSKNSEGEVEYSWAHIDIAIRRLWDPELADEGERAPVHAKADPSSCVEDESNDSNRHTSVLNIGYVPPNQLSNRST